jgi:hypothetical protein|tara:strand:- start:6349 stop:7113 length:765 start_codon:yes stop_codon:yes gene_type:complete
MSAPLLKKDVLMLQTLIRFLIPALCLSAITSFAESVVTEDTVLEKSAAEYAAETAEYAKAAKESEENIKKSEETIKELKKATEQSAQTVQNIELGGFNFSVGIGYEAFNSPYINEAVLRGTSPNQIVVVTDSYKANTSLWLTTNYVWDKSFLQTKYGLTHTYPGIFIGTRVTGENSDIFDAFGAGFMLALKRNGTAKSTTFQSVNIGIGKVWHRTQQLAYGITEGSALPASYTEVEYQKKDESSWMLMLSVGFN